VTEHTLPAAPPRRWFTWRRAVVAIALLAAFGVGTAAGTTKTITKTSTATRTVAPTSCKTAIGSARQAFRVARSVVGSFAPILPLVTKAAEAGATGNSAEIYRIAAKIHASSGQWESQAVTLRGIATRFNTAAAACEKP
jgi:hypothetical protein